jgi:hypothetical protein
MGEYSLFLLGKQGWIPGPAESEENFFRRVGVARHSSLPQKEALQRIAETFHARPEWVDVCVSSRGLCFWEGAATWIGEEAGGTRCCRIQIKDSFLSRLYSREEVIAHEMVHAMRVCFEERRFEEILAYQTSRNPLRRYCGPLFAGSKETFLFLLSFFVPWIVWWIEMCLDVEAGSGLLFFVPLMVLCWGILRLVRSQRLFAAALRQLGKAVCRKGEALAAVLGLTDAEIALFARGTPEEIRSFAEQQKEKSIRWKQLYLRYFR